MAVDLMPDLREQHIHCCLVVKGKPFPFLFCRQILLAVLYGRIDLDSSSLRIVIYCVSLRCTTYGLFSMPVSEFHLYLDVRIRSVGKGSLCVNVCLPYFPWSV